jgi:hypothetical protein
MPNLIVYINRGDVEIFDSLCRTKSCNRYQLSKLAIKRLIEEEKKKVESTTENGSRVERSGQKTITVSY